MLDLLNNDNDDLLGERIDQLFLTAKDLFETIIDEFSEEERDFIVSFFDSEEYQYEIVDVNQDSWVDFSKEIADCSADDLIEIRFSSPEQSDIFVFSVLVVEDQNLYFKWLVPEEDYGN
ncbi:MAG: hypothetical protein K5752_00715 [Succinivibrionaceae bacterium]|nr:hypothetical protein [Succinivibrionaceae bacterium]